MKNTIIPGKVLRHNVSTDVLLIGECLVDVFVDYQGTTHMLFGGSPANIMINTKQLGINTQLCSVVGEDTYGNFLVSNLENRDIDTSLIYRSKRATSKVEVTQTTDSPKAKFFRGADHEIEFTDKLKEAIKNTKVMHFSYWPLSKEPSRTTILKAIDLAKLNNVLIAFDPNIHKDLKTNDSITLEALNKLLGQIDIIKPSLDDARRLFKETLDKETYMDKFEAFGIELIMMTLGKEGVYVSYQGKRKHYPTIATDVIDSTGAGDAFWSGFYAALVNHYDLDDCIMLAQYSSSFALKQIGAITELPNLNHLVKTIMKDVAL